MLEIRNIETHPYDEKLFNNDTLTLTNKVTYTKSNKMWKVGCFYGTGNELIKKAYADSETSGRNYEQYVKFAEERN